MSTSVHTRRWRIALVAAGAAATAAAVLSFASPAAAAPSLTVTPSTGLTDGQSVTVTLAGFPDNASGINIVQCLTSGTDAADCNVNGAVLGKSADGSGALTVTMKAAQSFTGLGASTPIDCTKAQCMIAANVGVSNNPSESAQQNISFGSSGGSQTTSAAPTTTPPAATTTPPAARTTANPGSGGIGNAQAGSVAVPTGANTGEAITSGALPVVVGGLGGAAVALAALSLMLHRRRQRRHG